MDPIKFVLSLIAIGSTILNTVTCYFLMRQRKKTCYVILCTHLAISDLLQAVCGYVPELILDTRLASSTVLCEVSSCIVAIMALASISIITLISLSRIVTLKNPFRLAFLNTKKATVNVFAFLSWIYAIFWGTFPMLGWSRYVLEPTKRRCTIDWNFESANAKSYIYSIVVFCYILPVLIHLISFIFIRKTVQSHSRYCAYTYGRRNLVTLAVGRRKRKSFLLSLSMFSIFIIAWTPYTLIGILSDYVQIPTWSMNTAALLAKSSAFFNPLIYCYRAKTRSKFFNLCKPNKSYDDNITMLRESSRKSCAGNCRYSRKRSWDGHQNVSTDL